MKIFKTSQTKEIDAYTIAHEPIKSFGLMERAARCLFDAILPYLKKEQHIVVLAGSGNNGGDALVLAKYIGLLCKSMDVYLVDLKNKLSVDCAQAKINLEQSGFLLHIITDYSDLHLSAADLIIDGLFGSGLSRPLDDIWRQFVLQINQSGAHVFSIDIPSGLLGEDNSNNKSDYIIKAARTFTFQQPKLSFFFPENAAYVGSLTIIDIHLHPIALSSTLTPYYLTQIEDLNIKYRPKFSNKGTFGRALLIAGKYGMAGAAILASKACLRSGCGLLTVHIPSKLYEIIQVAIPEAIVDVDNNNQWYSHNPNVERYSAIGIGPGLGQEPDSYKAFNELLEMSKGVPMVIDADALNIISNHRELLGSIPPQSILTPHPMEFDRLMGASSNNYERIEKQRRLSREQNIVIVLKGAYSSVSLPDGTVHFNPTGNNGMATAGCGDVLTGIILSLLAQHYPSDVAAILGVYLHGLAGDIATESIEEESLIASDLINNIGAAFNKIKNKDNK